MYRGHILLKTWLIENHTHMNVNYLLNFNQVVETSPVSYLLNF